MLDEIAPAFQKFGYVRERMGQPALALAESYGPKERRLAARDAVNGIVAR